MTMKELARIANVSVSTVSKAFRNASDVSEETKQHIFAIAKEYGCYGKFYKGKYKKPIIAIIFPEIIGSYYSEYVSALEKLISKSGCIPLISTYQFDSENQAELIEYFSEYLQVDGIIVSQLHEPLKKAFNTPIVSVFNSHDSNVDCIKSNTNDAFLKAITTLRELGHKNIAFAGEPLTSAKAEIFAQLMYISPDSEHIVISQNRFEKAGIDCANKIINSDIPYTAVICAYDLIAIGLINQLQKRGYSVPEDFSVIGMDNIIFSEYSKISLTTIGLDPQEVSLKAWQIMQKKLKNKYYKHRQQIEINAELIIRNSIGPAKDNRREGSC